MKAEQDHAMVGQALPKDELTEVLVVVTTIAASASAIASTS
jgi:hypothetical protein